ncbi:hypothetical protein [Salinilacihabitans rarus]|uniref:hypothetical protein n=1 Tax=Salinilacihabitans rarus TaxID=2961596 RepID=UPI0020C89342|nr:hypothetical protein [Salinilacihabitans rarus]
MSTVTVEKVQGGQVYLRALERRLAIGDRAEVSEEFAAYLVDERGDFELVSEEGDDVVDDDESIAAQIEVGECPWCDEYEGENVGMHASRSHPEAWDEFQDEED